MNRYIYLLLAVAFFASCKNDSPVKQNPADPQEVNTQDASKVDNVKESQPSQTNNNSSTQGSTTSTNNQQKTVTVSTVEEIVEHAESNTIMYLEKGRYELESDLVYYITENERKIIDKKVEETKSIGGQLYFSGLKNFQLIGKNGVEIISKNPKAVAFFMIRSNNVKISNITVKKEVNGIADLCYISNGQNIEVDRCNFDGGGSYGIYINKMISLKLNNCRISNCTTGAMRLNESRSIKFLNSTFTENTFKLPIVNCYGSGSDVAFENVTISGNKKDPSSTFQDSDRIMALGNNTLTLHNCVIQDNPGYTTLGMSLEFIKDSQIDGVALQ